MPRKRLARPFLPPRDPVPVLPRRSPPPAAPAPPTLYCGWARTGSRGRWQLLVRAATSEGEALNRLRELTLGKRFVDLLVRLVSAGNPNDDDKPRPATVRA